MINYDDERLSQAYRVFCFIREHRGSTILQVANSLDTIPQCVSSIVSKLCKEGKAKRQGSKGKYRYEIVKGAQHPAKHNRYTNLSSMECNMVVVKSSKGNTIFDECRANWRGYQINKLLEGVRA